MNKQELDRFISKNYEGVLAAYMRQRTSITAHGGMSLVENNPLDKMWSMAQNRRAIQLLVKAVIETSSRDNVLLDAEPLRTFLCRLYLEDEEEYNALLNYLETGQPALISRMDVILQF